MYAQTVQFQTPYIQKIGLETSNIGEIFVKKRNMYFLIIAGLEGRCVTIIEGAMGTVEQVKGSGL